MNIYDWCNVSVSIILPIFEIRPPLTVDYWRTAVYLSQKWFVCYKGRTFLIYIAAYYQHAKIPSKINLIVAVKSQVDFFLFSLLYGGKNFVFIAFQQFAIYNYLLAVILIYLNVNILIFIYFLIILAIFFLLLFFFLNFLLSFPGFKYFLFRVDMISSQDPEKDCWYFRST